MSIGISQKKSSTKINWEKCGTFLDRYYSSISHSEEYTLDAWGKYHKFWGYKGDSALTRLNYDMYQRGQRRAEPLWQTRR